MRTNLVGMIWESIVVGPYKATSFIEAAQLGGFAIDNPNVQEAGCWWGSDPIGLDREVKVDIYRFNGGWTIGEMAKWVRVQRKRPIVTAHTMGIAIAHPHIQQMVSIIQIEPVQRGCGLCLFTARSEEFGDRRMIAPGTFSRPELNRSCVVGFLDEE